MKKKNIDFFTTKKILIKVKQIISELKRKHCSILLVKFGSDFNYNLFIDTKLLYPMPKFYLSNSPVNRKPDGIF